MVNVDAVRLAALLAEMAGAAFVRVDAYLEERPPRHEAQSRAHRANGIAVFAAPKHGAKHYHNESYPRRNEQCRSEALSLSEPDYAAHHAAVGAVRSEQAEQQLGERDGASHRNHQHPVAHDAVLRDVFALILLAARGEELSKVNYHILEYPHRADNRAVDAPEYEGQQSYADDYRQVEREAGRQQLELCHPTPPLPAVTDKKQRDSDEENSCQDDTEFL